MGIPVLSDSGPVQSGPFPSLVRPWKKPGGKGRRRERGKEKEGGGGGEEEEEEELC